MTAKRDSRWVPYPPSWIDVLTERVDRLPGPDWLIYVVAAAVLLAIMTLSQWATGTPVGTVHPYHVGGAATVGTWLWLTRRFNVWAARAMEGVASALPPETARALTYRITTLPAVPALLASGATGLAAVGGAIVSPEQMAQFAFSREPASFVVSIAVWALISVVVGAFWLKLAFQAWVIHRLLTSEVDVDVWSQGGLHAFSGLTARMAVAVVLPALVALVVTPGAEVQRFGTAGTVIGASLIFVLPLVGVHGRLVAEKSRLLAESAARIQTTRRRLHEAVESGETSLMDPLQKQMSALEIDQRIVEAIPTWPWQPETLRWVLGALMFPIVLFVLQQLIGPLVGR